MSINMNAKNDKFVVKHVLREGVQLPWEICCFRMIDADLEDW